jgi:hypothetical protein
VEVTTDRAAVYPRFVDELAPSARHIVEQYANNAVEADHGRLKARLRPMRGLKRLSSVRTVAAGHAFVQNLRRGHYEIASDLPPRDRVAPPSQPSLTAFDARRHDTPRPDTQPVISNATKPFRSSTRRPIHLILKHLG